MENNNGKLSESIDFKSGIDEDQAKKLFKNGDTDADGFLSLNEVSNQTDLEDKDDKISIDEIIGGKSETGKQEDVYVYRWKIDGNIISHELRMGGRAFMVAAVHPKDGETKVIKISRTQWHDDKICEEATILESIGDHKHIVGFHGYHPYAVYFPKETDDPILDIFHMEEPEMFRRSLFSEGDNDKPENKSILMSYFISDFCENGSFFDLILLSGGFNESVARTYFQHMLAAVEAMHNKGFVHRDLKPDNLLLDSNWLLQVDEFGFACKINSQGMVTDGKIAGTRGFMAPENRRDQEYGVANDVFAMGAIVFEFVFCRPPFTDTTMDCPWYRKVAEGDWDTYWKWQAQGGPINISDEFKKFIQRFFVSDQSQRITIKEIKEHVWYNGKSLDDTQLAAEMKKLVDMTNNANVINRLGEEKVTEDAPDGKSLGDTQLAAEMKKLDDTQLAAEMKKIYVATNNANVIYRLGEEKVTEDAPDGKNLDDTQLTAEMKKFDVATNNANVINRLGEEKVTEDAPDGKSLDDTQLAAEKKLDDTQLAAEMKKIDVATNNANVINRLGDEKVTEDAPCTQIMVDLPEGLVRGEEPTTSEPASEPLEYNPCVKIYTQD